MIKGEQTYLSNPAARQRDEFAIENEKLRARIAELEAAGEAKSEEIQLLENRLRVALDAVKEDAARIAELEREKRRVQNIIYTYAAARAALNGEK